MAHPHRAGSLTAKDDGSHDEARQARHDERVRPEVGAADGGVLGSHEAGAEVFRRRYHRHCATAVLLLLLRSSPLALLAVAIAVPASKKPDRSPIGKGERRGMARTAKRKGWVFYKDGYIHTYVTRSLIRFQIRLKQMSAVHFLPNYLISCVVFIPAETGETRTCEICIVRCLGSEKCAGSRRAMHVCITALGGTLEA